VNCSLRESPRGDQPVLAAGEPRAGGGEPRVCGVEAVCEVVVVCGAAVSVLPSLELPVPATSLVPVAREMPFPVAALLCRDPWPLLFDVAPFDVLARNHTSVSVAAASTYGDIGALVFISATARYRNLTVSLSRNTVGDGIYDVARFVTHRARWQARAVVIQRAEPTPGQRRQPHR
jgi:hypothetical protein